MSPGTTRSRHRARTLTETCGAARVSPWGQRAPRGVQAFALSLPPGSEMILLTQNDSLYIITGSDNEAQWIKKEPSILAHLLNGGMLPASNFDRAMTTLRGGKSIIRTYLESLKAGVCGSLYEWVTKNGEIMLVGLKVKPNLAYLNNSRRKKKKKKKPWERKFQKKILLLSCSRSSRWKNG